MDILIPALLIAGSYILGGIPSAYLVARYSKGIDIRKYGSGNAGATNVMEHVGKSTGFTIGVYDCVIKGTLPVLLAKVLDQGLAVQVSAGLVAILAHNWSPYLRFTGGRGVATAIGVVFGFAMWQEFLILAFVLGFLGRLMFRDTGFWTFIALLALPLLAFLFSRPPEVLYMCVAIGVMLLAKRVTANWEPLPRKYPFLRVMMNRILWDRDVSKRDEWTERRPLGKEG